MPTTNGQNNSDPAIALVNGIFESSQEARSPAIIQDSLDNDDCMDLPTYVSLIAKQSTTSTNVKSTQNLISSMDSPGPSSAEAVNLKTLEENQAQVEENSNPGLRYITVKPCDVNPYLGEAVLVHRNPIVPSNSSDESPAHHVTETTVQLCDSTNGSNAGESETNEEESDIAMPLNHSMDDESEDIPLISLPTAYGHPVIPSFPPDLRKEMTHRGGLVGSKIMKRSSSVISDSGIESEPSSVAWPLEAALRGRPPLDFSSEREIPQQIVCRHPVHRSSLEGLQMESNGSLPSAGIQASLTSISSLPYEEDQQQRQLSKLTKSVSAPQISSPEETEEDRVLLNQETDTKNKDSFKINCSSLNSDLYSEQSESSLLDPSLTTNLGHILKENNHPETSNPPQYLSETYKPKSVLSSVTNVLLLQESLESPHVRESNVIGSHGENMNHQTHISEVSASVEDVLLTETEGAPCSCGNKPCVHISTADQERINTGDKCQSIHQTQLLSVEDQECLDPSETPLKPSGLQHSSDLPNNTTSTQRPSDLTGLIVNDITSSVDVNGISASEKEPLDCQTKPSKIPNSGLAFVNKKMVEVVNMSVSCAPTCLPFSSVLRDSPSMSGMSARQATSPITHQPLGSFGIISSSSLNPLNMDDETNERMLKWVYVLANHI